MTEYGNLKQQKLDLEMYQWKPTEIVAFQIESCSVVQVGIRKFHNA